MKTILVWAMAGTLAACASTPPHSLRSVEFDRASHHAYWNNDGASLRGRAWFEDASGTQWTCAGGGVFLIPNTMYFRDLLRIDQAGAFVWPRIPEAAARLVHATVCREDGSYELDNLPANDWIMVALVPGRHGWMMRQATTTAQTLNDVMLGQSQMQYQAPPWALVTPKTIRMVSRPPYWEPAPEAPLPWGLRGDK